MQNVCTGDKRVCKMHKNKQQQKKQTISPSALFLLPNVDHRPTVAHFLPRCLFINVMRQGRAFTSWHSEQRLQRSEAGSLQLKTTNCPLLILNNCDKSSCWWIATFTYDYIKPKQICIKPESTFKMCHPTPTHLHHIYTLCTDSDGMWDLHTLVHTNHSRMSCQEEKLIMVDLPKSKVTGVWWLLISNPAQTCF